MATLIDSYSETNDDAEVRLEDNNPGAYYNKAGQSFRTPNNGVSYTLTSIKFYIAKVGTPTGNIDVKLYDHNGTYGTSSTGAGGIVLATAAATVDISTLSTSKTLVEFAFTDGYVMSPNTAYIPMIHYESGSGENYLYVGSDASSPTHSGNHVKYYNNTWADSGSARDIIFYVYGNASAVLPKPNTLLLNVG